MNEKKHEKNYGIEWLRILSMYMVAVLHTLGQAYFSALSNKF